MVNKTYLPDGERLEQLKRDFPGADKQRRAEWAREFGYKNIKALGDAVRTNLSISTSLPVNRIEESETPTVYQPYPDFKVKPFSVGKLRRDKEDVALFLADLHLAKVTRSYNLKVAAKRLDNILGKAMRIIELHRPIGKVFLNLLGDIVQGENIYQGSKIGSTECGAWEQINDYAIPLLSRFSLSLLQVTEEVEITGVWGNHGKYAREGTDKTNWDNFVYKGMGVALANQKKIKVRCPDIFCQLVNIQGFIYFLFHGHQIRTSLGIPSYGLRRKLQFWYAHFGGFHYAIGGHWHTWDSGQINSYADYQICPPLITDDEWGLEIVGSASYPIQLIQGVHPRQGRTWEYKLYADNEFLPKPHQVIG